MRTELKLFRVKQKLSQEEMAIKIGCGRVSYASIEIGRRNGTNDFWLAFQKAFNVPDEDMWGLMKNDTE